MKRALEKKTALEKIIAQMGGALVAYSGGVDSTFLAKLTRDLLGDRFLAVLASSELYPRREIEEAIRLARKLELNHILIAAEELRKEEFADNSPERCYICKRALYTKLKEIAANHGLPFVLDGANHDDSQDFRPGERAAAELGVLSPLKQVGLTKEEIRSLSREMDLPNWDKPSFACLSSRFPYGEKITKEKIVMVEESEDFLYNMGVKQYRVRCHGKLARIEVGKEDFPKLLAAAGKLTEKFKKFGFDFVCLDLEGYRTGSMNEVLPQE